MDLIGNGCFSISSQAWRTCKRRRSSERRSHLALLLALPRKLPDVYFLLGVNMFYKSQVQLIAFLGATLISAMSYGAEQSVVVKIGIAGPLSGSLAHLGKDDEFGARMAVEELNKRSFKIGDKIAKFELYSEDDAGDPKQGAAVAQKFVDMNVNGVVGHLNSGTSIPASKVYSDAGIPQISPASTNPKYTRQGYKTTFRVVADDTALGGSLGRYAVSVLKTKTVAVVDDRTAYGQGVAQEFEKAAREAGAQIVSNQFTNDKATDFFSILTNIKSKKPDLIFFGGMDVQAGPMLRQMAQSQVSAAQDKAASNRNYVATAQSFSPKSNHSKQHYSGCLD